MTLKERMLRRIRAQKKSDQTFRTYWHWCEKFLRWKKDQCGQWVHPSRMGRDEVQSWLSHLANCDKWVSANTQNVALQSVCYLYREVLNTPMERIDALRAKRPQRVRDVLDVEEVAALFTHMSGVELLVAQMIYGCGLRIGEVTELRMKDVSFGRRQLHIRSGKGSKERVTQFPTVLHESVKRQMRHMESQWRDDCEKGRNGVSLPDGWGRKSSKSHLDFSWWYLFASNSYSQCPRTGVMYRHHRDRSHLSRQIKLASKRAGSVKRITSHNLRHSFATHANEQGMDIKTLQALLGHADIRTTETYLHVSKSRATAAKSPLEELLRNPPTRELGGDLRIYG